MESAENPNYVQPGREESEVHPHKASAHLNYVEVVLLLIIVIVFDVADWFEFGIPGSDIINVLVIGYLWWKGVSSAARNVVIQVCEVIFELIPAWDYAPWYTIGMILLIYFDRHPKISAVVGKVAVVSGKRLGSVGGKVSAVGNKASGSGLNTGGSKAQKFFGDHNVEKFQEIQSKVSGKITSLPPPLRAGVRWGLNQADHRLRGGSAGENREDFDSTDSYNEALFPTSLDSYIGTDSGSASKNTRVIQTNTANADQQLPLASGAPAGSDVTSGLDSNIPIPGAQSN